MPSAASSRRHGGTDGGTGQKTQTCGRDGTASIRFGNQRFAGAIGGIPFSFSHDAPVSPQPWVLALVDAGVNRRSSSGQVIGPDQRVTPYQALRAAIGPGQPPGPSASRPCLHAHEHRPPPALTAQAHQTLDLLLGAVAP